MFKKARELTKEVYVSLAKCRDNGFRDQIQRASVSIVSNIAEGFESGTKSEFLNYLYIAKASAGEVRAQLYIALDVGYLDIEIFKWACRGMQSTHREFHQEAEVRRHVGYAVQARGAARSCD